MKRTFYCICIILLITPILLYTQEEVVEPKENAIEWSDFKLIIENNIFNPNRRKFVEQAPPPAREPDPQIDELILVGTLITETKQYAFFDGNTSAFRKVISSNDQIGNCTISEIHTTSVVLVTDINTIQLTVGKSIRRVDGGEWDYSDMTPSLLSRNNNTDNNNELNDSQDQDMPEASGAANDLLKQMMERRQQELNQ